MKILTEPIILLIIMEILTQPIVLLIIVEILMEPITLLIQRTDEHEIVLQKICRLYKGSIESCDIAEALQVYNIIILYELHHVSQVYTSNHIAASRVTGFTVMFYDNKTIISPHRFLLVMLLHSLIFPYHHGYHVS